MLEASVVFVTSECRDPRAGEHLHVSQKSSNPNVNFRSIAYSQGSMGDTTFDIGKDELMLE